MGCCYQGIFCRLCRRYLWCRYQQRQSTRYIISVFEITLVMLCMSCWQPVSGSIMHLHVTNFLCLEFPLTQLNWFELDLAILTCVVIMFPTIAGWHIAFSADPVGVGVASCLHSISLMNDGFWPNLHKFIIGLGKNDDYILMTLTPFSRSHKDLDCWKRLENCLSVLLSWRNEWILTIPAHLDCWDM